MNILCENRNINDLYNIDVFIASRGSSFIINFAFQSKLGLRARVGRPQTSSSPLVISLLAVPRRLLYFGSLVILDVGCCYLWLFLLYINIKIGKNNFKCSTSR